MTETAFHNLAELLTKALLTSDFGLYRSLLTLPMTFTPKDGKSYVFEDEEALRADFDLYVSIIKLHGVTDIYRQVLGFDTVAGGNISVRLMTHILVRANLLAEPFPTRMILQKGEGGWRICEIESAEGHLNWAMGQADISSTGLFKPKYEEN